MWIIPPLNILEDSKLGLAMIGKAMSVYQLAFKGSKEAFTQALNSPPKRGNSIGI